MLFENHHNGNNFFYFFLLVTAINYKPLETMSNNMKKE